MPKADNGQLPEPVARLYQTANKSLMLFLACQLLGLLVVVPLVLNYLNVLSQVLAGDTSVDPFAIAQQSKSNIEYLISGLSTSATAGWWLPIALLGRRLRTPYSNRAYKFLITIALLDAITYLLAIFNLFVKDGNFFGMIGTTLALAASIPVITLALKPEIRKWSARYIPPPPII